MFALISRILNLSGSHKKPEGLRLGANIRFLKKEQKEMLDQIGRASCRERV